MRLKLEFAYSNTIMILTQDNARSILERVLAMSRADEAEAMLHGETEGNLRFARNTPTTTGHVTSLSLLVTSVFGRRVGTASTTQIDADGLADVVARSEELARLAPESPEYMPRLAAQSYSDVQAWDPAINSITPEDRADVAAAAIDGARAQQLQAAGFYVDSGSFTALANSHGLFGYHRSTSAEYTLTVRSPDGNGSGWGATTSHRADRVDSALVTRRAIDKALRSRDPIELPPGSYPVVLESSPAGDMVKLFVWNLGRREADEGRSYFSDPARGTRLGDRLFDNRITIYSDPAHPLVPSIPWGEDGQPLGRTNWVESGLLKNLIVGRYWADHKGLQAIPSPSNAIMEGEEHSLDDLVAATDHGLLVTSFWYIRPVDPQTILHTGLTRDGLFMIENGKVTRPVVNFRWNESPATVLASVEMLGHPERIVSREGNHPMLVPPMKLSGFRFTSVSPST